MHPIPSRRKGGPRSKDEIGSAELPGMQADERDVVGCRKLDDGVVSAVVNVGLQCAKAAEVGAQIDVVLVSGEGFEVIDDVVIGGLREQERFIAFAAEQTVVARTAVQDIVAAAGDEKVGLGRRVPGLPAVSPKEVVTGAAGQLVVSCETAAEIGRVAVQFIACGAVGFVTAV